MLMAAAGDNRGTAIDLHLTLVIVPAQYDAKQAVVLAYEPRDETVRSCSMRPALKAAMRSDMVSASVWSCVT